MEETLQQIQMELKAPKGQKNAFGNYKYRSCEDIVEAVKPILAKYKCALTLSDEMIMLGDRFYIKATATIKKKDSKIETTGYAREADIKKGMDVSQITGAASSYARKYALNGLLAIDDTKDSDVTGGTIGEEINISNSSDFATLKKTLESCTEEQALTVIGKAIRNLHESKKINDKERDELKKIYNDKIAGLKK